MKMFVANCTQQNWIFSYRLVDSKRTIDTTIPMGGQIVLPNELSKPEIDSVIAQYSKYGMVNVDAIDRTKPFIGLAYSIDKKIAVDQIRRALVHNRSVLVEQGKTIREESAIALNNRLEEEQGEGNVKNLELSVIEEKQGGRPDDIEPTAEVMSVSRDTNKAPPAKGARNNGGRGKK